MADTKPFSEQPGRMGYQTAQLDKAAGLATAHPETMVGTGEERIAGVFKDERSLLKKYAHSTYELIYEGFAEQDVVIYYAVMPVAVEVRAWQASFASSARPTVRQRITDVQQVFRQL